MTSNLYWDACIFVAYLNDERASYGHHIDDIVQFLEEARKGERTIYTSSLTLAEINNRMLRNARPGAFDDFLNDLKESVILLDPSPSVMRSAGHMRGLTFMKGNAVRTLATPDAIHLSTALSLENDYNVKVEAFHTFDGGGGGSYVPLLGLEDWCGQCSGDPVLSGALAIPRTRPTHTSPRIPLVV